MFMRKCLLSFGVFLATACLADAQPPTGRTFAFLVACGDYDKTQLKPVAFTVAEMQQFRSVLVDSGIAAQNIVFLHDKAEETRRFIPTRDNIVKEFRLLLERLRVEDSIIVALSGHGVQFREEKHGYFCPLDAELDKKHKLLPMVGEDGLLTMLDQSKAGRKLLIVNACRNQPTSNANLAAEKLQLRDEYNEEAPKGTVMLLACKQGQFSWFYDDREKRPDRRNRSLFMYHLMEAWRGRYAKGAKVTVDHIIAEVAERVESDAPADFGRNQMPIAKRQFEGQWEVGFRYITNSLGMSLAYIPPGTFFMGSSKEEIARLNKESNSSIYDDEGPRHEVMLTRGYYMGIHEVTIRQFREFIRDTDYRAESEKTGGSGYNETRNAIEGRNRHYTWKNIGWPQSDQHPVVNVSWYDAKAFCAWLSKREGKTYALPSEAQWEYACRAGTTTAFHHGDDYEGLALVGNSADADFRAKLPQFAWGIQARDGYPFTAPVGQFRKNTFGLHDMHGNVSEWCEDWYQANYYETSPREDPVNTKAGKYRLARGGSWNVRARDCRSATGNPFLPDHCSSEVGFRVVLLSR